ncbi:MAG TPA: RNA polymerase sigma factor [Pyrinomonadaceae bacterium]|jgi:RNA polymerase sigma-70 factor (ECF subfamily)
MSELVAMLDEPCGALLLAADENRATPAPEDEKYRASDYALARQAASGDLDAFEEIYRRHAQRMYGVCLRMTGNAAEAEDLTQDVFVHIFRKLGAFRGESALTTWLHRVAVNQVLMHFRKRRSRPESITADGDMPPEVERGTVDPNRMPVIDRIALDEAVAQLPPGYRTVFVLHDVEGYEHREIAQMLGMAVGTSKSQLHKARMKLRSLIRRAQPERQAVSDERRTNAEGTVEAV